MMKHILLLLIILPQFAFATSTRDVKKKANETIEAASNYTNEQKEAFTQEMEENLARLKIKIKAMKSNADQSKNDTIQKLEIKQKNLENDLAKLKKSSNKAWGKLKTGISNAWSEIKTSFNDASDELK